MWERRSTLVQLFAVESQKYLIGGFWALLFKGDRKKEICMQRDWMGKGCRILLNWSPQLEESFFSFYLAGFVLKMLSFYQKEDSFQGLCVALKKKRIGLKTARSNLCSFRRNSLPCNEEVANLIKETKSCIPRILCENSLPINSRPIKVDENSFSGRC